MLADAGFDASDACKRYYAAVVRPPSLRPGRDLRMRLIRYFEGIGTERGRKWRCADSLSLRDFLGLGLRHRVPDHSWLSWSRPQC